MNMISVPVKILPQATDLQAPQYMTPGAAGMDLMAAIDEERRLCPGEFKPIPTGIAIALPVGYEAQVRPRSGLAARFGVTVLNAPGTIDADYRGEIKVILINHGQEDFLIQRGDRIAQLVVARVAKVEWAPDQELDRTVRGGEGFGHTGV